jgi:Domain of unknown function (DUF6484)
LSEIYGNGTTHQSIAMKIVDQIQRGEETHSQGESADDFGRLLQKSGRPNFAAINAATVGHLLAIKDDGMTALVNHPNHFESSALCARTIVELRATHVGRPVLLVFENADPSRPIIVGTVLGDQRFMLQPKPGSVEVDADGERLIVTAKEQLVLRCGSASITLTREGEVLVRGTLVSTHASGVNRITGGSVQIN